MKQNVRPHRALSAELAKDWLRATATKRRKGLLVLAMDDGQTIRREPRFGALWINRWVERIQSHVPPSVAFLLCATVAALAFFSRFLWMDGMEERFPFLMGLPVVVISAALFGAGPAMGAAIVGVILPLIYIFEPIGAPWASDPIEAFAAALYLAVSILVAITVCALSSAKALAVEYALERRRLHKDMQNLLHELRHRTKNELMQLLALAHLMAGGVEGVEAKDALMALAGRIRAVGHVHDMLSEVMDQPETPVDSAVFLRGLSNRISSAVMRDGIKMEVRAEGHPLRHTIAVPLGIVLNELTMNCLKHAFPDGRGDITISFSRQSDEYVMVVQDNGVGTSACAGDQNGSPRRRGLGQRVTAGLARSLGGTINSLNAIGEGMTCELRFPVQGRRA